MVSWTDPPVTSRAETRTENREPVFCFCSWIDLNNHEMAVGTEPSFWFEGFPNMVCFFPAI